jgi:hypothetical protein
VNIAIKAFTPRENLNQPANFRWLYVSFRLSIRHLIARWERENQKSSISFLDFLDLAIRAYLDYNIRRLLKLDYDEGLEVDWDWENNDSFGIQIFKTRNADWSNVLYGDEKLIQTFQ